MNNLDRVFNLYKKFGNKVYTNNITLLQQSTMNALNAEIYCNHNNISDKFKSELILSSFFYNIDSLISFKNIKIDGDSFLRQNHFSPNICKLIENKYITCLYLHNYKNQKNISNEIKYFKNNYLFSYNLKMNEWNKLSKSYQPGLLFKINRMVPIDNYYIMANKLLFKK